MSEAPKTSTKLRLAVLVSGGGSTLQNIIDAIDVGYLDAEIALVVSSRREVYALERAKKHGLATVVIRRRDFADQEAFDSRLCQTLLAAQIDLVILGGYLSILGAQTIRAFPGRIMNIHPSLLPAFGGRGLYGLHVHSAVLSYGCKVSGATVIFVDEEIDAGPIILQSAVPVLDDDTPDSLAERVAVAEREIYPTAIKLYCEGKLVWQGRRVKILGGEHDADEKSPH